MRMIKIVVGVGLLGAVLAQGATDPAGAGGDPVGPAGEATRPKIGLVLGGGGAKGFAHIGVLRVLEEMQIPIDYVAGTSMGAIIGALYSCGMSPDEIESFLESLNWWDVLSDKTPRRELDFRMKQDDQRYLFDLELGLKGLRIRMPTGFASGQKFNNLMQSVTLRAAGAADFDQLPIPFRAVATDLRTGEKVVLDHGNLATAMRASMAVPGAFTPVEIDGRRLVDGGLADNIPVSVARAMGADIILAVDVGASAVEDSQEKLDSLSGIMGQTYNLMRRPGQVEALKDADVVIEPDLGGFSASAFQLVSGIVPTGEQATRGLAAQLEAYRVDDADYQAYLQRQRRPAPSALPVSSVQVTGNQRVDVRRIRGRIHSQAGEPLDLDAVSLDLMRIYGIGDFERVMFRVNPAGEQANELEYAVKEKPWGPTYLRFGLRLQSNFANDADWQMLLNLTRMNLNRLGGESRTDLEFGSESRVFSEFYQPLDFRGLWFVAPSVEYTSELQDLYDGDNRVADYEVDVFTGQLDLGIQFRHYAELRAGPFWSDGSATVKTGDSELPDVDETVAGVKISLIADRQDRTLFAREGYYLSLESMLARKGLGSDRAFDKISLEYRQYASFGDHTLTFQSRLGTSLDSDLPVYAEYLLGGPHGFAGLDEGQLRGAEAGVISPGYRYRISRLPPSLGQGLYTMFRFDVGNVWDDTGDISANDLLLGGAVGLGADTLLGPAYLGYGLAEGSRSRFYLSLGTAF